MGSPERDGAGPAAIAKGPRRALLTHEGGLREVRLEPTGGGRYRILDQGREQTLLAERLSDGGWLLIDASSGRVDDLLVEQEDRRLRVLTATADEALQRWDDRQRRRSSSAPEGGRRSAGPASIAAPMAGRVAKVLVSVGERVAAGQAVAAVEAMKMENELLSPRAGQVTAVLVSGGDSVERDQTLLIIT